MKRIYFLAIIAIGITVLSFSVSKDQFSDDYIDYYEALENFKMVVVHHGDTATAQADLQSEIENLFQWESRMEAESESKWDTFETESWPGIPRNHKCHLECAYQYWRCKTQLEGDLFYCLMVLEDCQRGCNR